MAKPILVVRANTPFDMIGKLSLKLSKQFNDYHVLFVYDDIDKPVFETYNDCKGLTDIDIEKLIKEFNNGKIN